MVSSRSVWGAVNRSASVSSSLFRPCVPSSNRYPCTTSTTRGRVRIPRMAQRVKNAASVVCVTTRSYCSRSILRRSRDAARKLDGALSFFSSGSATTASANGMSRRAPPQATSTCQPSSRNRRR